MGKSGDHEKQPHVEQTERNASPVEPPQKKRTIVEKLGIYNILILVLGTVAIFLALAFLLFLWVDSDNARKNGNYTWVWYQIAWAERVSNVVTLSTVLIRLATGTQLGVFAALVAALILERVGASTADLPQLSIIRCANSGPHTLFRHVIHSLPVRSQWGYSIVIVIAILNAAVLQLTSTILLTDVGNGHYLEEVGPYNLSLGLDARTDIKNTWNGIDYWTTGPVTYPRFAENTTAGSRGTYYMDTGTTYRAFLPFGSEGQRSVVRNYTGPMTVIDARTVCVKPSFSDVTFFDNNASTAVPNLAGTLKYKGVPNVLLDNDRGLLFNCTVANPETSTAADSSNFWAMSLCSISANETGWPAWFSETFTQLETAHLFINMSFTSNTQNYPRGPVLTTVPIEQSETSDPFWSKLTHSNMTFDASLCLFRPTSFVFKTKAWAPNFESDYDDQTLFNTTAKKYEVKNIVDTFGATEKLLSLQQRGVFHLEASDFSIANEADEAYHVEPNPYLYSAADRLSSLEGVDSISASFTKYGNVHRSHSAIVQDVLHQTRNPALTLQMLFTILMQMAYYDFYSEFELTAPAIHNDLQTVRMPMRWRGIGVLLGLLGLHFALLFGVLVLFLTRTEMSLLGNAWQAISQVHSTDTAEVVHKGAMATDDELHGKKSKHDDRVRLAKSASSGRTEAMYVRQRHRAAEDVGDDKV